MTFQIKDFPSIIAAIVNHMRGTQTALTDFNVGAVNRTMVEAGGIEIDELYQQVFNGIRDAIPVATYTSFDFATQPPIPSSGLIRVAIGSSASATVIAAGTVFSSPLLSVSFTSTAPITILAGSTFGDVPVTAGSAGVSSNIASGQSFSATPVITGMVSATNLIGFANGRDTETPDQKKQRFLSYVSTLARATVAAIEYGAKTAALYDVNGIQTESVQLASVDEPYLEDDTQPVGLLNVYVHNGVGDTSSDLVNWAATVLTGYVDGSGNKISGWKAAGIHLVVMAATEVALNVGAAVTTSAGYVPADVATAVTAALAAYILSLDIAASFLYSEAVAIAMAVPGVANIVFSTPTADQATTVGQKFMPGALAVTAT